MKLKAKTSTLLLVVLGLFTAPVQADGQETLLYEKCYRFAYDERFNTNWEEAKKDCIEAQLALIKAQNSGCPCPWSSDTSRDTQPDILCQPCSPSQCYAKGGVYVGSEDACYKPSSPDDYENATTMVQCGKLVPKGIWDSERGGCFDPRNTGPVVPATSPTTPGPFGN